MISLNEKAVSAIEEIVSRGNDAEVRRKGDGVIVLEVTKKIRARSE